MCSRISKSHACTQYTLTASAPGAAGYLHCRYSLVAQLGTPKLGDTCRHSRLRRLNLPRVACISPLPLSAACTCPAARYLRPEPRCTCDARTCPPARPFASTALGKNISTYLSPRCLPFSFLFSPSHTFSQPVFPRNAPTSVFSQLVSRAPSYPDPTSSLIAPEFKFDSLHPQHVIRRPSIPSPSTDSSPCLLPTWRKAPTPPLMTLQTLWATSQSTSLPMTRPLPTRPPRPALLRVAACTSATWHMRQLRES